MRPVPPQEAGPPPAPDQPEKTQADAWESLRRFNQELNDKMMARLRRETGMIEFMDLEEQLTDQDIDKALEVLDEEKRRNQEIMTELRAKLAKLKTERSQAEAEQPPSEVESSLAELRQIEADRVAAEEDISAQSPETPAVLAEMKKMAAERAATAQPPETPAALADIKNIGAEKAAAEKARPSETESSLAELRQIEADRVAEEETIELSDEDIELVEEKPPAPPPLPPEVRAEADFFARGEAMDRAHAAGETLPGVEITKEGVVLLEDRSPSRSEVRDFMQNNRLPPDVRQQAERDLASLEMDADLAENGLVIGTADKAPVKMTYGWRDYEQILKENYGLDPAEVVAKKEVSKWQKLKLGLKSIFSPGFRKTWRAYEKQIQEYSRASEQADETRLMLNNPKAYLNRMENRRLSLFGLRSSLGVFGLRSSLGVDSKPPGGTAPGPSK